MESPIMPHWHVEPKSGDEATDSVSQHDPNETSMTFSSLVTYISTKICLIVTESEKKRRKGYYPFNFLFQVF